MRKRKEAGPRRHHRKDPLRILKHKIKRRLLRHRWLVPAILLTLVILCGLSFWMYSSVRAQRGHRLTAGAQYNVGSGYRNIVYRGKNYHYNNRIISILFSGVDSEGELRSTRKYTSAPRADSISLVVLDELNQRMTIFAFNRDTMTGIHKYTLDGKDRGIFVDHLGYAYTYGEGGPVSCRNLCQSVSKLLYGVPINEYVVTNRTSLPMIANIIGDVEVVVPNDDLAERGYRKGQTATINGDNLNLFVRYRNTELDLTNVGRMQRQQAYVNGAAAQVRDLLDRQASSVWNKLDSMENLIQTNITRSRYLTLIKALRKTVYNDQDYYVPEGEQVVGEYHDEFYPDQDEVLKKVIETFYIEG